MRVLAIDYGTKAIGLAISDELRLTVRPLATLHPKKFTRPQIIEQLQHITTEYEIAQIVIGLPIRMDGTLGDAAQRVQAFRQQLQAATTLPITTQDERLTSHEADAMMREMGLDMRQRKAKSDEYAAAIILRDYLETQQSST